MKDSGLLATLISVLSFVVATSTLAWSISSWRRSGPLLRVHALLYDDVLVLRIFNAGRSPDRLEQLVIGGGRHGRGGVDITQALGGPVPLAAGEAYYRQLEWRTLVPLNRQTRFVQGWESIWLLRGSMTEQRSEVLPRLGREVPRAGWELADAGSHQKRLVPLIMGLPLGILAVDSVSHGWQGWIFVSIVVVVLAYGAIGSLANTERRPLRTRIERALVAAGSVLILFAWTAHLRSGAILASYLVFAIALAVPGALSDFIGTVEAISRGIRTRLGGHRHANA